MSIKLYSAINTQMENCYPHCRDKARERGNKKTETEATLAGGFFGSTTTTNTLEMKQR